MKGRKPKDLELKILSGNPGKRSAASSDAPFVAETFERPADLDQYAAAEWDRLVRTLAPILSEASSGMVLIAADAYSQMRRASDLIAEAGGEFYKTSGKSGEMLREHPAVGMRDRARRAYHQALAELGASPVAHTRVKKLPESTQTELPGIRKLLG